MIWMEKILGEHNEFPSDVQFGKWIVVKSSPD